MARKKGKNNKGKQVKRKCIYFFLEGSKECSEHLYISNYYNKFKDKSLDANELEKKISLLMKDSEVNNKKGIYEYVLSGDEKFLNLRAFDDDIKRETYENQGGICPHCGQKFEIEQMDADHIIPWSKGGKTVRENCQMLCAECNRKKGNR